MKNVLFAFLVLLISSLHAQKSDEEILRHMKTVEWPRAYREQDTVLLNKILADEFQKISNSGQVTTKRNELDYIKKNKPTYNSFTFIIERLEVFENGTAIVSGTGIIKSTGKEGVPEETTYKSSNILIKRNGEWKAINSHVSGVKSK